MSDGISGIKIISPSYPVKPAQPAHKDRESGKRQKEAPNPDADAESDSDSENPDKPSIDEYI